MSALVIFESFFNSHKIIFRNHAPPPAHYNNSPCYIIIMARGNLSLRDAPRSWLVRSTFLPGNLKWNPISWKKETRWREAKGGGRYPWWRGDSWGHGSPAAGAKCAGRNYHRYYSDYYSCSVPAFPAMPPSVQRNKVNTGSTSQQQPILARLAQTLISPPKTSDSIQQTPKNPCFLRTLFLFPAHLP